MTDAWDDEDRVIARALGVDLPETEVGSPAAELDADADAVREYETVLAALPVAAVMPRSDLENEVVAAALARRPAAARAIAGGRSRPRRSAAPRWIAMGAAVAAAAAIAVVLAVGGPASGPGSPGGRIAPAASTSGVAQVLAEPGARTGVLRATNGETVGRVALGPEGQGFLYHLALAAPASEPRWLWLITGSDPVRVGRITDARTVHFIVHGDVRAVEGVLVTTEHGTPATPGPVRSNATLRPVS
jgi:hypothetical protein